MSFMNRLNVARNEYQGSTKKVLTVCSAGVLRSPTTAQILSSPPYNLNTRSAGISTEYALIPVDDVLISWANDIICMEYWQADTITAMLEKRGLLDVKNVYCLEVEDRYPYRDPELVTILNEKLGQIYSPTIDSPIVVTE